MLLLCLGGFCSLLHRGWCSNPRVSKAKLFSEYFNAQIRTLRWVQFRMNAGQIGLMVDMPMQPHTVRFQEF